MQKLGNDLFAGAMFAGDEHIGIGRAHLRDQFKYWLHRGRARDEFRHAFCAEQPVLELKMTRPAQSLMQFSVHTDEADQALIFPWLLDEIARSSLDAFDGEIDVSPGGHDNYWYTWIDLLQARKQIESFLARSRVARVVEIDEQDIVVALP